MLRYDLARAEEADLVETAVDTVLQKGYATADIQREGTILVGCWEMGEKVKEELANLLERARGGESSETGAHVGAGAGAEEPAATGYR